MKTHKTRIITFIMAVLIISCKTDPIEIIELNLDPAYQGINSIHTIANCTSPAGQFTTEVKSNKDGSCLFIQRNSNDTIQFAAQIDSSGNGLILDSKYQLIDTLSAKGIEMIRGHETHRIMSAPASVYSDISYDSMINLNGEALGIFNAKDGLGNPIKLFYDPQKKRIKKIELLNPLDTTQSIEIVNNAWMTTEFGKMPKVIDIIQAKKDTYRFFYTKVELKKE